MALTWVFTTLGMGRNSSDMWVVRCMIGFIIVAVVLRAYCYGSVGVAMLKHNTNLITDLWPLADLKTLTRLELPCNYVSDLMPLEKLTALETLIAPDNQIFDLTPLAGLKNLKQLIIFDNPELTRTEIDKLHAALPNCVIRHNAKKL